jgi:uncharacterized membrane protein YeaQ/YmgE (transglycosylase-associated protein family)
MLINLIIWIVIGFVAGYLAKLIMPGPDGGGFILTTILGIIGAFVGGFIGRALHIGGESINDNDFNLWSLILAVIGAIVVLAIYRLATGRSVRS